LFYFTKWNKNDLGHIIKNSKRKAIKLLIAEKYFKNSLIKLKQLKNKGIELF
jgi:hypothetical protein